MGQKISVPEKIHRAAKLNDIAELQALCADMHMNRSLDPETKRSWLNWTDEEGRTALMWAAQKNHLHIAQLLLDEGADIHAISPKRNNGGSALAEAIAGKHEALVELLLRYGGDPFTENPAGKTPLDLALEGRAVSILRACERHALFAGHVSTRVGQLKGFSYTSKDRWVVIAPRFTPPPPGGSVGEVRVMMLLFRNVGEADPRTKVWLDGAAISMRNDEALLRLHPNHVQPRNIYSNYDAGWVMYFKPARAQGFVPLGALPTPQNPEAAFAAFLATSSRPLEQLHQQQQLRVAAALSNPWAAAGAPPAPAPPAAAAGGPYAGSTGGSFRPVMQQQQPHQQPYMHAGLQMQPAAAPPSASMQRQQPPQGELALMAEPGESDEAFAQRLAAMYGSSPNSTPRHSGSAASPASTAAPSAANSNAPSRLGSATAQQQQARPQQQQQQQQYDNPFAAAGSAAAAAGLPQASGNPFRAHGATSGGGAQPSSDSGAPSAPPAAPSAPSAAAAAAALPQAAGSVAAAMMAAASASSGGDGDVGGGSDADLCVICLSAPREVGLLHGTSVHRCLCKECAPMVRVGTPCPMCRQNVERILGVY